MRSPGMMHDHRQVGVESKVVLPPKPKVKILKLLTHIVHLKPESSIPPPQAGNPEP